MKRPMIFFEGEAGGASGGAPAGGGAGGSATLLGGATQAAAATAAPVPVSWIKEDGSFSGDWLSKLPEDLRGNPSLTTVNSLPDLAKSYVETKRLVGKRLEMPGEGATPEQISEFRKVTGAPEKPEGYLGTAKSLRPEAVPENAWDAEGEKKFLALAHKWHLPPAAVKEIIGFHAEQVTGHLKQSEASFEEHLAKERSVLRNEWGKDYDATSSLSLRMMQTAGMPTDRVPTVSEYARGMAKIARLLSEDKLVRGENGSSMAATVQDRIRDITDPKSQSSLAREYRGDFGNERQKAAQDLLHQLMDSQTQKAA